MYLLYKKSNAGADEQFERQRTANLFGRINGIVPRMLSKQLEPHISEPQKWHIDVPKDLRTIESESNCFIIDLKPKNRSYLSLYELLNVWGISESGWTPIMLHLRPLLIDHPNKGIDINIFRIDSSVNQYPVFTFLYLDGTIKNGQLEGKWTAPAPSATNSTLLWPETFSHFSNIAQELIRALRHRT